MKHIRKLRMTSELARLISVAAAIAQANECEFIRYCVTKEIDRMSNDKRYSRAFKVL